MFKRNLVSLCVSLFFLVPLLTTFGCQGKESSSDDSSSSEGSGTITPVGGGGSPAPTIGSGGGGDAPAAIQSTPLGKFTITSPKAIHGRIPTITWSASTGAAGYHVVIASDSACKVPVHDVKVNGTSYASTPPLTRNSLYYVCVFSRNAAGTERMASNAPMKLNVGGVIIGAASANINPYLANGLALPSGVAYDGTHVIVVDSTANRVLIWNSVPSSGNIPPSLILGQANSSSSTQNYLAAGALSASGFSNPSRAASDGTRLVVTDTDNRRVLIWTTFPTTNNQPADLVLGQTSLTSNAAHSTSASTLLFPEGVAIIGTGVNAKLAVVDPANNRVLIWNTFPTSNGQAADVVVGQNSVTGTAAACTANGLDYPNDVASNGTKLFISDTSNHRVLVYNSIPTAHGASANFVLGQPDLTTCDAPSAPLSAEKFDEPSGLAIQNTKLLVADKRYSRVLVYASLPSSNNAAADYVIGQSSMTTNTWGLTANGLSVPDAIAVAGSYLFITDPYNHRVMVYNGIPASDGASAQTFIGQVNGTTDRFSPTVSGSVISSPGDIATDGTRVAIADTNASRVLIWNSSPTSSGTPADVVVGQASMSESGSPWPATSVGMSYPGGIALCAGRLVISDTYNSRVMVWNQIPKTHGVAASFVLGQASDSDDRANRNGPIAANTLSMPGGVTCTSSKLIVADVGNSRVLIWNTFPTTTGQAADVVVGQSGMSTGTKDVSPTSLGYMAVSSVATDGTKLFVSDNGRILIYDTIPTSHGAAASQVLGTADLNSYAYGPSRSELGPSTKVAVAGKSLVVTDNNYHRVLRWSPIPTADGAEATGLFGQPDYVSRGAGGNLPLSDTSLHFSYGASGVAIDDTWIYVADTFNRRVVMLPTHAQ